MYECPCLVIIYSFFKVTKLTISECIPGQQGKVPSSFRLEKSKYNSIVSMVNRPISKVEAKIQKKSKLKMYTNNRKNAFTLVIRQSFSISGVI